MKSTFLKNSICLFIFYTGLLNFQLIFAQQLLLEHQLQAPGHYSPDDYKRVTFGDMDGDGDLDLIAIDLVSSRPLVYLNQNGKMDSIPQFVDLGDGQYTAIDWNADGLSDFLIQKGSGVCELRINQGVFSFSAALTMSASFPTVGLEIRDLNQDGYPDIFSSSYSVQGGDGKVWINSQGTDSLDSHNITTPGIAFDYNLCDLDGDGVQELVQTYAPDGVYIALRILKDNGNFNFTEVQTVYLVGDAGAEVYPVDLDGDQRSEIIYSANPNNWRIVKEISPGQYSDAFIGTSPANYSLGLVYDLDGNGFKDVGIGYNLFMNNQFNFTQTPLVNPPYTNLVDLDSDGLVESYWTQYHAKIFHTEYVGNGVFQPYQTLVEGWPADETVTAMDIEKDGDIDFLYFSYATDYLILSRNDNGVYSESIVNADNIFPYKFFQLDYNGDGYQDFIAGYYLFVNDGQGHFAWTGGLPGGIPIGAADLNNDGLDDVVIGEPDQFQQHFMRVYINTGNGFVQTGPITPGVPEPNAFLDCIFKDLNGDGLKDMIRVGHSGFYLYENTGGNALEKKDPIFGRFVGASDMNGDGRVDLLAILNGGILMWPNLGGFNFGQPELVSSPDEPIVNYFGTMIDLTADGLDDIIIEGAYPSAFAVLVNEGSSFGKALNQGPLNSYSSGYSELIRTPFLDFDQDGDLDIYLAHQVASNGQRFAWLENTSNSPNKIVGKVFFDANGNGLRDVDEPPASGIKLGLENLGAFAISDSSGQFSMPTGAATGDFTVKILPSESVQYNITTPGNLSVSVSTASPVDTTIIGLRISGAGALLNQALSSHRCNETARLWIPFTPRTNGPASGELKLTFPNGVTWQDMDSLPGVVRQGREIRWPLNQLPTLSSQGLWVDFKMPDFQFTGDTLLFASELLLFNGPDTVLLRDTMFELLTCAYDPNDKRIANIEQFYAGEEYYTLETPEPVEYLIRFQNTGNDTAKQVVILDNLTSLFDYGSLQVLGASHPCRVNLDYSGLLRIEFPDINLPDSTTNFIGSMGFVKFSVSLKPEPPRNKQIRNFARIYFDQNPPVQTKVASFRIVDCDYFTQGLDFPDGICETDSVSLIIPTHGLEQSYSWVFNDIPISNTNSASFQVIQYDNVINLTVNNAICQVEKSIYFHSSGAYPDLQLSVDSSAVFCEGTSLEITSNIPVIWYQDGIQVGFGLSYEATASQTLLAETYIDGTVCQSQKTVYLTSVEIPHKLILNGGYNNTTLGCEGDSMAFHTGLENGDWKWLLYDASVGQVVDTSRASSYQISFDQIPYGFVRLVLDTLNCTVEDYRSIQTIPEGAIQITGDSVICYDLGQAYVYTQIGDAGIRFDSLFWYKGDTLLQVAYHDYSMMLDSVTPGEYTFVAYAACNQDTIQRIFYPIQPFLRTIQVGEDTLLSGNGQPVTWFYAPALDSVFLFVGDQSFLGNLSTGYYFMAYTAGNCAVLSDTVFVQSTQVINPLRTDKIELFPNPNTGTFRVKLPTTATSSMSFHIIGLAGQVIKEQSIQAGSSIQTVDAGDLPPGLYFLQVVSEGKVLAVEKFVKQ